MTNINEGLCIEALREHVDAIARLKSFGHEVILISSGAVAAGFADLGYPTRPVTMVGKQAASAVGQGLLMQAYTDECKRHDIVAAQLLLTRQNILVHDMYKNANAAITELLRRNVLPIINENDSISVKGMTFGDNDMLSALISGLVHADFLMILTDINGIYGENPHHNPEAKKYNFLPEICDELVEATSSSGSSAGTGGMKSKVEAARTALDLGVQVFIGKGIGEEKLVDILEGKGDGTYIGVASQASVKNSKQWLALHSIPKGKIEVDEGAEEAILKQGKSLLPVGVTKIIGSFVVDDVVEVVSVNGTIIGKGQVNYCSKELSKIKGLPSKEAMARANNGHQVVIHRNQWIGQNERGIIKNEPIHPNITIQ